MPTEHDTVAENRLSVPRVNESLRKLASRKEDALLALMQTGGIGDIAADVRAAAQELFNAVIDASGKDPNVLRYHLADLQTAYVAAHETGGDPQLSSQMGALLNQLMRYGSQEKSQFSINDVHEFSRDLRPKENEPDVYTAIFRAAADENTDWVGAGGGAGTSLRQIEDFQLQGLRHYADRVRRLGKMDESLMALCRLQGKLESVAGSEKEQSMVAWNRAQILRTGKNFGAARNAFQESATLAKVGGDDAGAVYNTFNVHQTDFLEMEHSNTLNQERLTRIFDAIETLRADFAKHEAAQTKRVGAMIPNMTNQLVEIAIARKLTERARSLLAELVTYPRVQQSIAEGTVWKKTIADLEQRIGEID